MTGTIRIIYAVFAGTTPRSLRSVLSRFEAKIQADGALTMLLPIPKVHPERGSYLTDRALTGLVCRRRCGVGDQHKNEVSNLILVRPEG